MGKAKHVSDEGRKASKQDLHHDEFGREIPDPVPLQPPVGYRRAPSLAEQIRQGVLAAKAAELREIQETEEEADDFDIGDDFDPQSPWENDNIPSLKDLKKRRKQLEDTIELERADSEKKGARSAPKPSLPPDQEHTPE